MLSFSDQKLLQLAGCGVKNKEIAHRLGLSTNEVRVRIDDLLRRLGLTQRVELLLYACSEASRPRTKKQPAAKQPAA
jgi:DNA-binding NarL/FixJ family response regulator